MQTFQAGEEASQKKLMDDLGEIHAAGTSMLDQLEENRLVTLVNFERRLGALNGRRVRASRTQSPGVQARFVTSDFGDTDQLATTATVRADSQAVTLRERSVPVDAVLRSVSFTASVGEVEQLDRQEMLYRVTTPSGVTPTGVFALELRDSVAITLLVMDMAAMLSEPTITVEVSSDNVSYLPAISISRSGYRLNAWVKPQLVRFARVTITPSHPDAINGSSFTFGLTDFYANSLEFNLESEWVSRPILMTPRSLFLQFRAASDTGLEYALKFDDGAWLQVEPDTKVAVEGVSRMDGNGLALDAQGCLSWVLEENAYLSTLRVVEEGTELELPVVPGLRHTDSNQARLLNKYIAVEAPYLYLVRDDLALDIGKTYRLSYLRGPEQLAVELRVRLSTADRTISPIFRGATLEEV